MAGLTFTIYNCGTCFDEQNKGELIAKLYAGTKGVRGFNKLICAGPGSTLITRPGYDPAKDPDKYKFASSPWGGAYQGSAETSGALSGRKQIQFNVKRVLETLKDPQLPKVDTVNMAGWSRGACAMPSPMP